MKKFLSGLAVVFILVLPALFAPLVRATSQQAYSDYLYQFDQYRQTYSDFQLGRDTYLKYHTLTSQTLAVTSSQKMMTQRNLLLRSYLAFLNEKLNEDQGLDTGARNQYQGNLQTEIDFLDTQNRQLAGITSIDDATRSSSLLENHYVALQKTIRETIIGITIGKLSALAKTFDQDFQTAQTLVTESATVLTPEKVSTINRWFSQIQNTRSLYQQKIDEINTFVSTQFPTIRTLDDITQRIPDVNKKFTEAQQLLSQAVSYLSEVVTALQYK